MLRIFFFLLIFLIPFEASAAWSLDGVCIADQTQLLDRFVEKWPKFSDTGSVNLVTTPAPTFDQVTGQLNFRFWLRPYATGIASLGGQNAMVLPVCDVDDSLLSYFPIQDILFVLGVLLLWAKGFQSGLAR